MHTRQLQQYTRPTINNYTQDNLKLATINTRQLETSNNTHKKTTTIHTTNQQQLHTRQLKTSSNTHETNYNTTCTKGKNTQTLQYCVQFLVIVFLNKGEKKTSYFRLLKSALNYTKITFNFVLMGK